jgi:hypothetical protein
MFRTRLTGVALLALSLLSGCGMFRDRPGLCNRCADRQAAQVNAAPVAYTGGDAGCGASVIPPGGAIYGQPMIIGPGGPGMPGEMLPPPIGGMPRIPKAGIDEKGGKQFELEGVSRTGPVLPMPIAGVKPNPN